MEPYEYSTIGIANSGAADFEFDLEACQNMMKELLEQDRLRDRMRYREYLMRKGIPCDDDAVCDAVVDHMMKVDRDWQMLEFRAETLLQAYRSFRIPETVLGPPVGIIKSTST